ncbi:protein O-mannosyl-transferase family [Flavobacterium sp.]|uniref:protein O-mannosyl-transferase family n=1 Tax=Flavobacterium sp. TaxID=239 RepID=UPI0039E509C6
MATFNFSKWNTITGWLTFSIALITYTLTVEPTMSFWDCGEYIATAAKLEVGHPPGAPLFQMMGAFFAMFAPDAKQVALMVNMMSVFSSAFTILFMFWSTTIVLRKFVSSFSELDDTKLKVILGSAFVASLAFTFSDSFWFNAVEAEVYAMATLFIAAMFWLGLRWEADMHTPRGNKWLLLISLMTGLSFGVHFMALLTIPAIGLLYYFKHYKTITVKNFIIANAVVIAILLFIFKLLLPWTMAVFGKTEIFMVNSLGLPFDSGTIFVFLAIIGLFYFGLKKTKEKGQVLYNTIILCVLFILIGFSTWMMLPIRANANVVINENKPSDAAEVLAYYNREQYGVNPLFYGPQFSDMFAGLDENQPYLDKKPNYERDYKTGKYIITNNWKNAEQNSDDNHKTILPRMWSTEHAENYMNFTHALEFRIKPEYAEEQELVNVVAEFRKAYAAKQIDNDGYVTFLKEYGDYLNIQKPTTWDNLSFMVEYQFGYMYWRYLMWNFTGRQNDIQGKYDNLDGNWLSGINFIDEAHLGSQQNLPADVLNNHGRNVYFFLPFILGIIGLVYHANRDLKSFYILLVLFLFTGLALKIYLNERPFEPRERDYALVGSFYVFAIWIAFGIYAIYEKLANYLQPKIAGPVAIAASLLAAPVLMASQNWDDHDRSGKYTAIAMAKAYLDSCEPNAILFTIGDNDTFPLWYAQEIEGVRPDIKIVNTSLFMTDWYIDQMKRKTYTSDGLPISFKHDQYVGDKLDYAFHNPQTENRWNLKDFIGFIASDNPQTMAQMQNGQFVHFYPTNKVRIPINKENIIKNKVVAPKYYDSIVPYIDIEIKGQALYKNRLMMLDVLANNDWKRPIYFTGGSFGDDDYLWMKDYLQLDGMVYKLVPIRTPIPKDGSPLDMGQIDTDKMYNIVMKWDWGNSESPKIYHDPETRKNSISYRTNLARLMEQQINEGKKEQAKKVIDLAMTKMPVEYFGYYSLLDPFAGGYYEVGEKAKARQLLDQLIVKYQQNLDYYKNLEPSEQNNIMIEIITDIERYRGLLEVMKDRGDAEYYAKNRTVFNRYNKMFERFGRDDE